MVFSVFCVLWNLTPFLGTSFRENFAKSFPGNFGGNVWKKGLFNISMVQYLFLSFRIYLPVSFFTVSSCITTYKKTPPPVPPRTSTCSSKPYISITAQSSTESAQVLRANWSLACVLWNIA